MSHDPHFARLSDRWRISIPCLRAVARGRLWLKLLSGLVLGQALLSGCDQSVDPLTQSDRHFSIYGALDASADTQWIRVMPVRVGVLTDSGSIDAHVTLEEIGSGRTTVLKDSLFKYASPDPDRIEHLYAHNFWTTDPIAEGETYRLNVQRSDGVTASALATIPRTINGAVVSISQGQFTGVSARDYLTVYGVDELAFVQVFIILPTCCRA